MKRKGLICVFTGNGKGKTTAALGAAFRAAGQGLKVLILQFMKKQKNTGEIKALECSELPIELKQYGYRLFFKSRACEPIDILRATQGLAAFQQAMESNTYDLIILDEINIAIDFGLIAFEQLRELIARKPNELHLILTGRNAPQELIKMADLVTEMREVKHHYNQGVQAQKGIEF
jgi:cob(I)alamin adenosyltransferase